ncbi:MAG: alpha/beta hydrolase [Pseudomonadota bacterium]
MSRLLVGACLAFVAIFVLSYIIDANRTVPEPPQSLSWWAEANVSYVTVDGVSTRYVREGDGPDLLLLHTFSTELGQFRKMARELSEQYTVWAFDLPGFGYSDLPDDALTAQFYANYVRAFMNGFSIDRPIVVGESIGGTVSLMLSASNDVGGAVAVNPIGYTSAPLARSGRVAAAFSTALQTPFVSDFVLRIRNERVTKAILQGALYDTSSLSDAYFEDLMTIQQRPELPEAQKLFAKSNASWVQAIDDIKAIAAPTSILWGEKDWSTVAERETMSRKFSGALVETISASGHFMTLDRPEVVMSAISKLSDGL